MWIPWIQCLQPEMQTCPWEVVYNLLARWLTLVASHVCQSASGSITTLFLIFIESLFQLFDAKVWLSTFSSQPTCSMQRLEILSFIEQGETQNIVNSESAVRKLVNTQENHQAGFFCMMMLLLDGLNLFESGYQTIELATEMQSSLLLSFEIRRAYGRRLDNEAWDGF